MKEEKEIVPGKNQEKRGDKRSARVALITKKRNGNGGVEKE